MTPSFNPTAYRVRTTRISPGTVTLPTSRSDLATERQRDAPCDVCHAVTSNSMSMRPSTVELQRVQTSALSKIQPKLSGEMVDVLRAPISLEELSRAVKEMAKQKAPGPDGIITEFYQILWPVIGKDYWQMTHEAIQQGSFPKGVTEGVISMLYKGGTRNTINS
jgi:hypothetical protein